MNHRIAQDHFDPTSGVRMETNDLVSVRSRLDLESCEHDGGFTQWCCVDFGRITRLEIAITECALMLETDNIAFCRGARLCPNGVVRLEGPDEVRPHPHHIMSG